MQSRTKKAIEVREYFYLLEELIDKYKNYIIEGLKDKINKLEHNQKPKVNPCKGIIYIIQTTDDITLYKIGKTINSKTRFSKHNSPLANDLEVIFQYETENIDQVESCIKSYMKLSQYRKYKEIYQVDYRKAVNYSELKSFSKIREIYEDKGHVLVHFASGTHKIKKKAEQMACEFALQNI
jgi:hypothetical protein